MPRTFWVAMGTLLALSTWGPVHSQPNLLQPANGATVFVPLPPFPMAQAAVDFDWEDVPGATSYEINVRRVGAQTGQTLTTAQSRLLVSMLEVGTAQLPTQYRWTVTPFENGVPGIESPESFFGIAGGTVVSFSPAGAGPGQPRAAEERVTRLYFQNVGMVLQWESVSGATRYEIQIRREADLNGTPLNQLHSRMTVGSTQAIVSNLTLPGKYRFDVRGVVSGAPGESSNGVFYLLDRNNLDQTHDYILNIDDLFELQRKWQGTATTDDIIGNGRIDQDDLIALLIRFKKYPLSLPGLKKETTPETGATDQPERSPTKPLKTGWLQGLKRILLGSPAYALEAPNGANEIEIPRIVFPTCKQCGVGQLQLIWTEALGATSYEIESYHYSIPGRRVLAGTIAKVEVFDAVAGDGIVTATHFTTFQQTYFVFGVRAIVAGQKGHLSRRVPVQISFQCPTPPAYPLIPLDFDNDRQFDGGDLLAFAAGWKSATPEIEYERSFDLDPPFFPNGDVGPRDLLRYKRLFRDRCLRPKSPALAPPIQQSPSPGFTIRGPQSQAIVFSWIPPATTELSSPLAYEIELTGSGFGGGLVRRFSATDFIVLQILTDGVYSWRVRAIADDGTVGIYSPTRQFSVETNPATIQAPTLVAPAPGAFLPGGSVRFVWTREAQVMPNQCRFDRLEIHNGNIFKASFDVYHKGTEVLQPTVEVELPLFPNFGPNFTWRVRPFEESTDSLGKVFILGGIRSGSRSFQINRPTDIPEFSGLGTWKSDINNDGDFDFTELAQVQTAWKRGRDTSPGYDVNFDFNYNKIHEPSELLKIFDVFRGNIRLLTTGRPSPLPLGPLSPHGSPPQLFTVAEAQFGTLLTWFPTSAAEKYMIEWIDPNNYFRGVYAEQLSSVTPLSPSSGQTVSLLDTGSSFVCSWTSTPNTLEYALQVTNLRNGLSLFRNVLPVSPSETVTSTVITAQHLINSTSPIDGDSYGFRVHPKACGYFTDLVPELTPFTVDLGFKAIPEQDAKQTVILNTELRLPLLLTAQTRIPAQILGLNHWRVTAIDRGIGTSTGNPSRWNSFGIGNRGPAYSQ